MFQYAKFSDKIDNEMVHPVYPVDGEQVEFCKGDVYWNCRSVDYIQITS